MRNISAALAIVLGACAPVDPLPPRGPIPPQPFSLDLTKPGDGPFVQPWKTVALDPAWAGQYMVAGDLDGDGQVELVAARNDNQAVTTLIAYRLDGSVLWRWGTAETGSVVLNYDLPLQIYDLDGDGRPEVWFGVEGAIMVADGATGHELRRLPLPTGLRAADCITFAALTRPGRPTDIVIKDRYSTAWAYDAQWNPLWTVKNPGGYRTCHHPERFDVDGDGIDELMIGFALVDAHGRERWTFRSEATDLARGHLDCARLVRPGLRPEEQRLVLTCCGAENVALVDGAGRRRWEHAGLHFESADVGELRPDVPGLEIVVDVDHRPFGDSPVWVLSESGERLGTIVTGYSRFHDLVDWDGDGADEIVLAHARRLVDGWGRVVATFALTPGQETLLRIRYGNRNANESPFVRVGDFTGDGRADVVLHSEKLACIYRNPGRGPLKRRAPPGTPVNFTLY